MPEPVSPPPLSSELAQPWSFAKLAGLLRMFGPAAVIASVAIGAGETIVAVRAGAWMGYGILWVILLAVLVKAVTVTYFLGRYTAISGETIGDRLVRLPGPRGWLLLVFAFVELAPAAFLWAALARPSGELLGYLIYGADMGNANRVIATLFILAALAIALTRNYSNLERQQLIICGILVLGTIVGAIMVRPDLVATLQGLLSFGHIPKIPSEAPAVFQQDPLPLIAVTFGYIGGSVMTYLVYPDFIGLKGWGMTGHPQIEDIKRRAAAGRPADYLPTDPAEVKAIRKAASTIRWDVACGAAVLLIVSASFLVAGAAVLFPKREAGENLGQFEGWRLLTDQAYVWEAIHPTLVWVYYACVVAALWGTLQAYPDVYSRCLAEYFKAIWPTRSWNQRRIQLIVSVYVFTTACAVIWSNAMFDLMTFIVSFFATTVGVALAMLAGLYLNFQLPPAYRTRWWTLAAGIASAGILILATFVTGAGLWQQLTATP